MNNNPRQLSRQAWLTSAAAQLHQALSSSHQLSKLDARREAMLILCHGLMMKPVLVRTWPDELIAEQALPIIDSYLKRRLEGEPIAYILGYKEFWSLKLDVNEAVLIPRPETELLVEQALTFIKSGELEVSKVADLGTGSGAIALAIASECPTLTVTAVDISRAALEVAQHNAHKLNLSNVEFIESAWYQQLTKQQFQLIVANPPYIAPQDPHLYQGDLPYEPDQALAADEQGFSDIQCIISGAHKHLVKGGYLMLEHGYDQATKVRALLEQAGFAKVASLQDLAGHERISLGQLG